MRRPARASTRHVVVVHIHYVHRGVCELVASVVAVTDAHVLVWHYASTATHVSVPVSRVDVAGRFAHKTCFAHKSRVLPLSMTIGRISTSRLVLLLRRDIHGWGGSVLNCAFSLEAFRRRIYKRLSIRQRSVLGEIVWYCGTFAAAGPRSVTSTIVALFHKTELRLERTGGSPGSSLLIGLLTDYTRPRWPSLSIIEVLPLKRSLKSLFLRWFAFMMIILFLLSFKIVNCSS